MAAPRQSGFGFFSLSKKRLESFFIGRRPVLNALAEILLSRPSITRMKRECDLVGCREMLRWCKLWSAKEKQVLRNWRRNAYTRYCQKFAVNLDFGHVTPSSRLRSSESRILQQPNRAINVTYIFAICYVANLYCNFLMLLIKAQFKQHCMQNM